MPNRLAEEPCSLARLELIEVRLPLPESFRSAVGERAERRALLVRWRDRDGAWGIGECSCRPDPFFSAEFNAGVVELLRGQVLPLIAAEATLGSVETALGRIRGWPFARAVVLEAALDLLRRRGVPDALDERPPQARSVPAGVSLGLFSSPSEAVERVGGALDEGYLRVKIKVAPGMDLATLEAARKAYPGAPLAFDANGTCDLADTDTLLTGLVALSPLFVEQPFPPSRLDWCAEAKERLPELRIALDESVEDLGDLEVAHRLGAIDELNLKPGRVGGQVAALELIDRCEELGLPVWVGGMFETGIGRAANLRVAARIRGAQAHDLSPSRRYFDRDLVAAPVEMDGEGMVPLGDERPVELDEAAFAEFTVQRWELAKE